MARVAAAAAQGAQAGAAGGQGAAVPAAREELLPAASSRSARLRLGHIERSMTQPDAEGQQWHSSLQRVSIKGD